MALARLVLFTVLLAAAWVPIAQGAAPGGQGPGEPRWLTLRNGTRVLLAPDPRAAAVSLAVWIEAGVRYERPGILGISHLTEHLSTRGVLPGGDRELRRRIEAEGGTMASFTSADFTCVTYTVPRGALGRVVQLEAGRFTARPTQTMLDEDREVTLDENRVRAHVDPFEKPLEQLYAAAFPDHPYRWPVLGTDADLGRVTLADCEAFLRSRYVPDQALITIVGDFDPDEALADLRRHIEPIKRGGGRRPPAARQGEQPAVERRAVMAGELPVPVIVVGWRAPAGVDTDGAALETIATLLAGGGSGRLARRLVSEEQTCLFTRAGRDRQREATVLWVAAAVRPGADSAAVERALMEEVDRLASEALTGEELDRVRRQVEVAMLLGRQSATDRGQALGTAQMVAGDWRRADDDLERLRSLTPADVQGAAQRSLAPLRRTVVWLTAAAGDAGGSGP